MKLMTMIYNDTEGVNQTEGVNHTEGVNQTSYNQSTIDIRETYENVIWAIVVTIIMCEGILGNLMVIVAIRRFENLREEVSNMFIINLSITDMCTSSIVMFSSLIVLITDGWPLGSFWCNFVCAANYCLIIVSMLTLCFISIDRFFAIKYPLHYSITITRKRVLIMIFYAWFQGIMFAIVPVMYSWIEFDYWEVVCAISWYKERQQALFYVIFAFSMCFLIPGIVLIYCYCAIFNIAHQQARQINQTVRNVMNDKKNAPKYSTSKKAVKSLLIIVIAYFLCMAPFSCTKLYKVSVDEYQPLPNYLNLISSVMAFISSGVNPLIYGIFRKDFRRAFKLLFTVKTNSIDSFRSVDGSDFH